MLLRAPSGSIPRSLLTPLTLVRNRHVLIADAVALSLTPAAALAVRLDGRESLYPYAIALMAYTTIAVVIRMVVQFAAGLYNRDWRYATVDEMAHIVAASGLSTLLLSVLFFAATGLDPDAQALPRSLPLVEGLLALLVVGGVRFSVRLAQSALRRSAPIDAKRVLVAGAGYTGQMIVRELQSNEQLGLAPVAFIDDDARKQGNRILNLPVLGGREALEGAVQRLGISQVIIAMPRAPGRTIREVLSLCEQASVPAKTVPGLTAILDGKVRVSELRDVQIEDLLRREPIRTDTDAVDALLRGKRVLITGAGGSIGGELCRQALRHGPAEMGLLGHGENSVFDIHNELREITENADSAEIADVQRGAGAVRNGKGTAGNGKSPVGNGKGTGGRTLFRPFIGDLRSADRIGGILREFRPDIIFHAAAHKHVPLMELNPTEAVSNNVLGTRNLVEAAIANGVERLVMISTDKAVNPTSVMGASKRAAEMVVLQAARATGRQYVAVRFGNVLGSRGSVVPLFKRQIASGGPITVCHPEMSRYFMTIPEAVQLVLQAAALGCGGEIFMLSMGQPVKIVDLARDLIELSGLEVGRDVDIVFTGMRHGEKLFEELSILGEEYRPTRHPKIVFAANAAAIVSDALGRLLPEMERAVEADDPVEIVRCLKTLIPEYEPDVMHGQAVQVPTRAVVMVDIRSEPAANTVKGRG
jgi:FlaA1/EpsC-like NDP-sugar epimerase